MKTDTQLHADVTEELRFEPRVDDNEIAVSVHDGTVSLRGTVGSLGAKHAATTAAKRVAGVRGVRNELEVRLLTEHRRDDAELRGSVLRTLSSNAAVPDGVDAKVDDGTVTLTGIVDFRHQRDEAERMVRNLRGVRGIDDEIKLRSFRTAADVSERIESALRRRAGLQAGHIRVDVVDGTATLRGTVDSWAGHDSAVDAAWAAPGVQNVDDQLEIAYVY